jgi:class 3 adenylate cyclase/pimeloyl-ACP methyl ester carboxylesterase
VQQQIPAVEYARAGDLRIAYQVVGDGPIDVMFLLGFPSQLEMQWEHPSIARFYRRLGSFSRLLLLDRRGTGLSDRGGQLRFEDVIEDVIAVMDDVGSQKCALIGHHAAGRAALMFAATHPERTTSVVTIAGHPTTYRDDDYPWGTTPDEVEELVGTIAHTWGSEAFITYLNIAAPSVASDPITKAWWPRFVRNSASAPEMVAGIKSSIGTDIRPLLQNVRVPALILHRSDDRMVDIRASRYMADRIPGARFVEVPGVDNLPFFGDQDSLLDELEEFLTGTRTAAEPDRVLATVLITDIVGSTDRATELGDRRWRDVLDAHEEIARRQIRIARGRLIKSTGDGILATFDGPARAIACARALHDELTGIGVETRAGLHTGEIELRGDDIGGIAVHIGARVSSLAGAGEVLVSRTVADLVTGSGIAFVDRGSHALKGVPGEWQLFAVKS